MASFHTEREVAIWNRARRRFLQSATAGGALLAAPGRLFAQEGQPTGLEALKGHHPIVHAIADDILKSTKYTLTAAGGGRSGSGHTLADDTREFLRSRNPVAQVAYIIASTSLLGSPSATSEAFGRYAKLRPEEFLSLGAKEQMARVGGPIARKNDLKPADIHNGVRVALPFVVEHQTALAAEAASAAAAQADLEAGKKFETLLLQINRIRCLKTTDDPYYDGGDILALGGVAIGATGGHHKISEQVVFSKENGGIFKPGGETHPDKLWHFAAFHLEDRTPFPHGYGCSVAMGALGNEEKSKFAQFLDKVWSHIKSLLYDALGDAIVETIAISALSAIPFIGTVIGAIVGAIINWLIGLCHHSNPDKVIGHQFLQVTQNGMGLKSLGDLARSGGVRDEVEYSRSGSHYILDYEWRLLKPGETSLAPIGIIF